MTVLHVFMVMGGAWRDGSQMRYHSALPWDEAYDLMFDPETMKATMLLARVAAGKGNRLQGRVFDAMRMVKDSVPELVGVGLGGDVGPYALATTSATLHRIELERLLADLSQSDWDRAFTMGRLILDAVRKHTNEI